MKDPNSVATVQVVNDLSRDIIPCWESLGTHLGVNQSTIDGIKFSLLCIEPGQKAFEVLKAWRDKGSSSTYRELAKALRHVHKDGLAEKYC